jgi:DNA primase
MTGSIPEEIIDQIKERVNIVDVVSDYVSLKKVGVNHKGLCPFHSEKTPSFTVNEEKQIFHCFGCGAGGNAITFLMRAGGMTFPDAMRELAKRVGVTIPESSPQKRDEKEVLYSTNDEAASLFQRFLRESGKGLSYLKNRGLEDGTISEYRLGYGGEGWDSLYRLLSKKGVPLKHAEELGLILSKKSGGYYDRFRGRVIFPIIDIHGHVIGFGGRSMDGSEPKYLNSPESPVFKKSESLYGLAIARRWVREADEVLIVEGYMDLLSLHQAGIRNAVATLGTALTSGHLRLIKRLTSNVVTVFDSDEAGIKATIRSMDLFLTEGVRVRVLSMPEGHDPDTFVREFGPERFKREIDTAKPIMEFFINEVSRRRDTKGVAGKLKVVEEVLPYIEKVPSGIERSHYLKVLSERLGVREDVLAEEIRKRPGSATGRFGVRFEKEGIQRKGGSVADVQWRAEKGIIQLALKHPELRAEISESGVLADYRDEGLRRLGELILASPHGDLLENLGSDEEKGLYSRLLMEMHDPVDPAKELADCIRSLRQQKVKREKERLRMDMEDAAKRGDEKLLLDLRERHRLLK